MEGRSIVIEEHVRIVGAPELAPGVDPRLEEVEEVPVKEVLPSYEVGRQRTRREDRGFHPYATGGSRSPRSVPVESFLSSSVASDLPEDTGGKPLFAHWVSAGFIVGSEAKYPAWAPQAHLDYFCNSPTNSPSMGPLGTCWVFSKSTQRRTQWAHFK
jgi:hypothetical protein